MPRMICFVMGLLSKSTIAMGTRVGVLSLLPNNDPKNAAMAIGAASVMMSARLLEKYRMRSLRTKARKAVMCVLVLRG